jgi:hypothetical protein
MHTEGTKLLEEKCDVIYAKSFEESKLVLTVGWGGRYRDEYALKAKHRTNIF